MILQALNRYYDILLEDLDTQVAAFGYSTVGVSFALDISGDGELLNVLPLFDRVERGKKTVEVPRTMILPAQVKRAVNIAPNFLWDNTTYVLVFLIKMKLSLNTARNALNLFATGILICFPSR
jgi:CRISPR-associated protein Csd1